MSAVAWRFAPVALVMITLALFQPSTPQTIATPTRAPAASSAASETPASSAGEPGPTEFPDLLPDLPAVVRRSVFKEPAFASDAAPFKLPSSKHPLGTILIVAHVGLVEIDLESFAIVQNVDVGDLRLGKSRGHAQRGGRRARRALHGGAALRRRAPACRVPRLRSRVVQPPGRGRRLLRRRLHRE